MALLALLAPQALVGLLVILADLGQRVLGDRKDLLVPATAKATAANPMVANAIMVLHGLLSLMFRGSRIRVELLAMVH